MDRKAALALLKRYNANESLVKHALSVEGVMRSFARRFGEDEEYWGVVGLLHDLDYERFPEQHCHKSKEILEAEGYDPAFVRAVMSHAYGICTDVRPEHVMEKVLYATDELTGLITATAYMRPSHSVMDLEVKSLKKKFKQASFAAGVNRDVITEGCHMLGLTLEDVMEQCILGMRDCAQEIGLMGQEE